LNIQECDIYIALITKNFRESEMCLNELGAAWVLDKIIYPLILPPINYNNFGLLISDLQALDISKPVNIKSFLISLQSDLLKFSEIDFRSGVNMENMIVKFGKSLRQFLRQNPNIFKSKEPKDYKKTERAEYINHIPGIEIIKKQSQIEWPGDTAMQDHYINSQLDAFRKLAKLRVEVKNTKLVEIFIKKAEERYPNDYVNQLNTVKQQIDK
jgi:hypothetical protein